MRARKITGNKRRVSKPLGMKYQGRIKDNNNTNLHKVAAGHLVNSSPSRLPIEFFTKSVAIVYVTDSNE
jgi:hypothetical protein